jgi:tripartite ATP-independent transporter DctP family solute receptor
MKGERIMKLLKKEFCLALTLTFAATIFSGSLLFAAEYSLRAHTINNPQSIHFTGMKKFKTLVEERSNGKIEVKLFHSGSLGDQRANLESLQSGTIDIATCDTPITTIDELMGVFGLPYIFRDRDHVQAVLYGPTGGWVADRLRAKGLEVLAYFEGGFRQITNNKRPIYKPSDLKGVKMRTPGSSLRIKTFNHYGANASALPYAELYSALQMGVYDGQENPAIEVKSSKFYEVQKYLSFTNHVYTVSFFLMSQMSYKKLPWDLQLLLKHAAYEASVATVAAGKAADSEIAGLAQSKGMKINQADIASFVEISKPIWDDYGKTMGDEATRLISIIEKIGK